MRTAWEARSHEERALLNPAFLGFVLWNAVDAFAERRSEGMHVGLGLLVPSISLHPATRLALPRTVRTSLAIWLQDHPFLREGFAARARSVSPSAKEALGLALEAGLVVLDGGLLQPPAKNPGSHPSATDEMKDIFKAARFVGRWFSRAGDAATIYALWGVRP